MSLRNRESCFQLLCSLCPQIAVSFTTVVTVTHPPQSRFKFLFMKSFRTAAPTAAPSSPPPRTALTKANLWYESPSAFSGFQLLAPGDTVVSVSPQHTSLSSLDDSLDQFDGSESQSSQNQPPQKAHRGQRSPPVISNPLLKPKARSRTNPPPPHPCPVPIAVSSANGSVFRSFHAQQSDTSSSEELLVSGKEPKATPRVKGHMTRPHDASAFSRRDGWIVG